MIFGHLKVMKEFKTEHPPDANILQLQLWIGRNFKRFFPDLDDVPPIVYLDLWPLFNDPLAILFDVDMARQLTQTAALPRSRIQKSLFAALTENLDLFSMEGNEWRVWRSRFNPAFSIRSITAIVPEMIEEVEIFAQGLEQNAGANGSWGEVFPLAERTTSLTLDVIVRATM